MENNTYFAFDGSYGNGNDGDIIIVNTANWSDYMWEIIDECADDNERMLMAQHFDQNAHTLGEPDNNIVCRYCGMTEDELTN